MARPYVAIDEKVSDRLRWTWVGKATHIICLWSIDLGTVRFNRLLFGVYKFKVGWNDRLIGPAVNP
jgi:hypothetical protein